MPETVVPSDFTSHNMQNGGDNSPVATTSSLLHMHCICILYININFGAETKMTSRNQFYLQILLLTKSKMATAAILKFS